MALLIKIEEKISVKNSTILVGISELRALGFSPVPTMDNTPLL